MWLLLVILVQPQNSISYLSEFRFQQNRTEKHTHTQTCRIFDDQIYRRFCSNEFSGLIPWKKFVLFVFLLPFFNRVCVYVCTCQCWLWQVAAKSNLWYGFDSILLFNKSVNNSRSLTALTMNVTHCCRANDTHHDWHSAIQPVEN